MTYQSDQIAELLKDATAEQHRDAERRRLQKDLVRGALPAATYAAWLSQMFLLHRAVRDELGHHDTAAPALAQVVQDGGRHVANLRADLTALGLDADATAALPATRLAMDGIRAAAAAEPLALLGHNYVLEGSMNGNRFIARALAPALRVPALTYLDPYGESQRATWQGYRERMNGAAVDARQAEQVVGAARDMFRYIADISDELMENSAAA